jgi:2-amino-4-hydroxy-6-hydroxymethyldihydropteridine diphosphokinase
MSDIAFIALGSNLGDRAAHLAFAREQIGALPTTRVLAASEVEETAPLGGLSQPRYLNQMLAIATDLAPHVLLASLQAIEAARGRMRGEHWASRTLDLDIVSYNHLQLSTRELTLPHPGLSDREFWQHQVVTLKRILSE